MLQDTQKEYPIPEEDLIDWLHKQEEFTQKFIIFFILTNDFNELTMEIPPKGNESSTDVYHDLVDTFREHMNLV